MDPITMIKHEKDEIEKATRRGLLHGFIEGFSGPLLMAASTTVALKIIQRTTGRASASLARSSREVGLTMRRGMEALMRNNSLVFRKVAVRKMGTDGKYHTIFEMSVGRSTVDNEPQK